MLNWKVKTRAPSVKWLTLRSCFSPAQFFILSVATGRYKIEKIYQFVHFALPKTPSVTTQLELDVQYQGAKSPVSKLPFFTIFSKEMYRIYLLLKICTELTFRCRYACCGGGSCCCNCKMKN